MKDLLNVIPQYWKALIGFVTPGAVALVAAVQDGTPGGSSVTGAEWVGIGVACVLTGGLVAAKGNVPKPGKHEADRA